MKSRNRVLAKVIMTIITKPSLTSKKDADPIFDSPVDLENGFKDEHEPDLLYLEPTYPDGKRSAVSLLCLSLVALLVAGAGVLCGLQLYQAAMRPRSLHLHTFQGFCSVPVKYQDGDSDDEAPMFEPQLRVPLHWTATPEDVQKRLDNDLASSFREQIDISPAVERISVFGGPGGREISFIHDFNANVSGIVDSERCFLMDMDPDLVLPPAVFIMDIESGADFDITRIRDTMRAVMPNIVNYVRLSRPLAERCADRLTYRLERSPGVIRKRSTDPITEAHFAHFAGKHVQEVAITNLDELIAFEKGHA